MSVTLLDFSDSANTGTVITGSDEWVTDNSGDPGTVQNDFVDPDGVLAYLWGLPCPCADIRAPLFERYIYSASFRTSGEQNVGNVGRSFEWSIAHTEIASDPEQGGRVTPGFVIGPDADTADRAWVLDVGGDGLPLGPQPRITWTVSRKAYEHVASLLSP